MGTETKTTIELDDYVIAALDRWREGQISPGGGPKTRSDAAAALINAALENERKK
jgi:hypothetical protein